jgi:hypothetical protein
MTFRRDEQLRSREQSFESVMFVMEEPAVSPILRMAAKLTYVDSYFEVHDPA